MKNSQSSKIEYQIEKNQKFHTDNKHLKTTNVNILLNRVRQENKNNFKKKIIFSITTISVIFFICILTFRI